MAYFTGPNKSVKRVSGSSAPSSTPSSTDSPSSSMSNGMRIFWVVLGVAAAAFVIGLIIYYYNKKRETNYSEQESYSNPYSNEMRNYQERTGMSGYMKNLRTSNERW